MFRHVVMFRWEESTTEGAKSEVRRRLAELPGQIPEVRSFRFGDDAGMAEGNHDVAVVVDFDDAAAYEAYAAHPAHVAIVTEWLRPNVSDRAAVQFVLEE